MRQALAGLLLMSVPDAEPAAWQHASEFDGLVPVTADERAALVQRLRGRDVHFELARGDWYRLTVPAIEASLRNDRQLLVDGDLRIRGSYDDEHGEGCLVVLGDLEVEHLLNRGCVYVAGRLRASGLVFAYDNDHSFEVDGGIDAAGLVIHDKSVRYEPGRIGFVLEDRRSALAEAGCEQALVHLDPELFTAPGALNWFEGESLADLRPDFDVARERAHRGLPLFRATAAGPEGIAAVRQVTAEALDETAARRLLAVDPLIPRLLAVRGDLSAALRAELGRHPDPVVRHWLRQSAR